MNLKRYSFKDEMASSNKNHDKGQPCGESESLLVNGFENTYMFLKSKTHFFFKSLTNYSIYKIPFKRGSTKKTNFLLFQTNFLFLKKKKKKKNTNIRILDLQM
jgi:hypothetical protein